MPLFVELFWQQQRAARPGGGLWVRHQAHAPEPYYSTLLTRALLLAKMSPTTTKRAPLNSPTTSKRANLAAGRAGVEVALAVGPCLHADALGEVDLVHVRVLDAAGLHLEVLVRLPRRSLSRRIGLRLDLHIQYILSLSLSLSHTHTRSLCRALPPSDYNTRCRSLPLCSGLNLKGSTSKPTTRRVPFLASS